MEIDYVNVADLYDDPITRELVDAIADLSYDHEFFWNARHDEVYTIVRAKQLAEEVMNPIIFEKQRVIPAALLNHPLADLLARFLYIARSSAREEVLRLEEEEGRLLALLYRHTPSPMIAMLRDRIVRTLDLQRFDPEFGRVLIENVEVEAYFLYPYIISPRQPYRPGPHNALFMKMMVCPREGEEEGSPQVQYMQEMLSAVVAQMTTPESTLAGDPDGGKTLLDLYLMTKPNGAHPLLVPWIIDVMENYRLPFVYFAADGIHTSKSGSSLHTLVRSISGREPAHPNILRQLAFGVMTLQERLALDGRERTALQIAETLISMRTTHQPALEEFVKTWKSRTVTKSAFY